jgi:hypothetical protein
MILTTQREIQVWTYLKANRKRLRPVVEARCRNDGRLLAAVYPLRDEFWAWHLGERYSPEQWSTEVEIMTEDLALEEEPPATGDEDASRSPSNPPVDNSARNFSTWKPRRFRKASNASSVISIPTRNARGGN